MSSLGITSADGFSEYDATNNVYSNIYFSATSGTGNIISPANSDSNSNLYVGTATVGNLISALNAGGSGNVWSLSSSGALQVADGGGGFVTTAFSDLSSHPTTTTLGLSSTAVTVPTTYSPLSAVSYAAETGSSLLSNLSSAVTTSDTLTVNGHTITFASSGGTSVSSTGGTIDLSTATTQTLLDAIKTVSGATSSIDGTGAISLSSSNSLSLTGSVLSKLGLTTTTGNSASVALAPTAKALTFGAVGNGAATTITFGTGSGQVSTLDQLNAQLGADNLQATLSTAGALTITTTNDAASASIGTIGGAATTSGGAFHGQTASAPVADAAAQTTRATLVSQYNAILTQIDNTASDASYNGVNLLNGDQLQLTFNETGKSKLNITGVNFGSAGLGLSALTNSSFQDNDATNSVLTTLNTVSATLRSEASALGSNLSVVQTRQDFNTNLINVLQTGSANLTQADINLEAANSQALSTRQSLSVSALSLANQSQQSVLQLLR